MIDVLGEECKGYEFWISGRNDKWDVPMKQDLDPEHSACCWVRSFPAPYQGEVKRGSLSLFMDVSLGVLNVATAKRKGGGERRILLSWQILLWLRSPKITRRIWKCFSFSKEGDVQQYAVRKSLRKKLRSWGPEHLRSVSCHSTCPVAQTWTHCSEETVHSESWGGGCWIY